MHVNFGTEHNYYTVHKKKKKVQKLRKCNKLELVVKLKCLFFFDIV